MASMAEQNIYTQKREIAPRDSPAPSFSRALTAKELILLDSLPFFNILQLYSSLLYRLVNDCSEETAKEALLYSYKSAASGFSAKLTPEQVEQISKENCLNVEKGEKYGSDLKDMDD
ncbi:hypothetical protein V8G54_010994 [Vigna mungo]|uniref:Inhibitor I9 domain-containing protein n=1 Tax=Vigna mungo TaxID=3915 RepID=A0AAQ3S1W2_VIGMU